MPSDNIILVFEKLPNQPVITGGGGFGYSMVWLAIGKRVDATYVPYYRQASEIRPPVFRHLLHLSWF